MDIARLGVEINPQGAVQGAAQATQALDRLGRSAQQNLGQTEQQSNRTGRAVQQMGRQSRAGFTDMASGIQGVLQGMGLMNGPIGRLLTRFDSMFRSSRMLTQTFRGNRESAAALAGESTALGSAMTGMGTAATGATVAMASMGVVIAGLLIFIVALLAAITAVGLAWATFKKGLPIAANFEDATNGFAVLMGSFEQAETKMDAIKDFAGATPFTSSALIQGARQLEVMTGGLLNNEEGWRMVGDAAAAAQKDFGEVSMWVGRMYAALQGGQPIGEATMRLMEMGVITPQVKGQLEEMAKTGNEGGARFAEIWGVAEQSLKRFSGTMALQSQTWNGLVSTAKDNWQLLQAEFAEPIMIALKPALQDLIRFIQWARPIAANIGAEIGYGVSTLTGAVRDESLGVLLATTLIAGFETVADWWTNFWVNSVAEIGNMLGNALGEAAAKAAADFHKAFEGFVKWFGDSMAALMPKPVTGLADKAADMGPFKWIQDKAFQSGMEAGNKSLIQKSLPDGSPLKDTPGQKPIGFLPSPFTPIDTSDLVGTTWRDMAAQQAMAVQPNLTRPELPAAPEMPDFSPTGTGGGAGGKGGKDQQILKAEPIISEMEKLMDAFGDLGAQIDQAMVGIAQSITGNMTEAITGMIMGTKSAKQAFQEMASAIVSDIIRMIIQMTIKLALAKALGQYGMFFQGIAAGVAHGGGTVGDGLAHKIQKYHQGGELSSEATVRLDKGETVLTRRRSAELARELQAYRSGRQTPQGGDRTQQATIINVLDRNEITDAVARNPGAVVNAMSRSLPAVRKMVLTGNRP